MLSTFTFKSFFLKTTKKEKHFKRILHKLVLIKVIPNFLTETKERDGMKNGKKEEVEKSKKPEGNHKDKNGRKKEDFFNLFFL